MDALGYALWTGLLKGLAWAVALLALIVLYAKTPWWAVLAGAAAMIWALSKLPGPDRR